MKSKVGRYGILSVLAGLVAIALCLLTATPSQAHWADLAAAEVVVQEAQVQMTLTFPTGLLAFADDNQDGQLSATEVTTHRQQLQTTLAKQIRLTDSNNRSATLSVEPSEGATLSPSALVAPNTHSTLQLTYAWDSPVQGLRIQYGLFLPGVPTASCVTTILQDGHLKTHVFTPTRTELALTPGLPWVATGEMMLAIAGAFVWGAVHSMSPGHGKTVVGAYLVGERATPRHAIFLAMTTTITHTIGVFALGLVTLFAARYILPEQLYPWLSLASGLMVVTIGVNLLRDRFNRHSHHSHSHEHHSHEHYSHEHHSHKPHTHSHRLHTHEPHSHELHTHEQLSHEDHARKSQNQNYHSDKTHTHSHHAHEQYLHEPHSQKPHAHGHAHEHSHESHSHQTHPQQQTGDRHSNHPRNHRHNHTHHHDHIYRHDPIQGHTHGHAHSHLPPGTDSPITWKSLLALGISGGLVPCPAALVLLLSAIALGNVSIGLILVLSFSLGLACVLTSLGLLLVYAKHLFKRVPAHLRFVRLLPAFSAMCITLIGLGISAKAILQMQV